MIFVVVLSLAALSYAAPGHDVLQDEQYLWEKQLNQIVQQQAIDEPQPILLSRRYNPYEPTMLDSGLKRYAPNSGTWERTSQYLNWDSLVQPKSSRSFLRSLIKPEMKESKMPVDYDSQDIYHRHDINHHHLINNIHDVKEKNIIGRFEDLGQPKRYYGKSLETKYMGPWKFMKGYSDADYIIKYHYINRPVISKNLDWEYVKPAIGQNTGLRYIIPVTSRNVNLGYIKPVIGSSSDVEYVKPVFGEHSTLNKYYGKSLMGMNIMKPWTTQFNYKLNNGGYIRNHDENVTPVISRGLETELVKPIITESNWDIIEPVTSRTLNNELVQPIIAKESVNNQLPVSSQNLDLQYTRNLNAEYTQPIISHENVDYVRPVTSRNLDLGYSTVQQTSHINYEPKRISGQWEYWGVPKVTKNLNLDEPLSFQPYIESKPTEETFKSFFVNPQGRAVLDKKYLSPVGAGHDILRNVDLASDVVVQPPQQKYIEVQVEDHIAQQPIHKETTNAFNLY